MDLSTLASSLQSNLGAQLPGIFGALGVLIVGCQIIGYLPRLVAGTILALVAWLIATLIRAAVNKVLASTTLDERLSKEAGMEPMSRTVASRASSRRTRCTACSSRCS